MTAIDVAARWMEFAEIDNVRDLGGLPVTGGGRTRFGVAYRSSTLQHLTESDVDTLLGAAGVRAVLDLRSPDEALREGYGKLAERQVRRINLPVRKAQSRASDAVPDSRRVDLVALYRDMLAGSPESVLTAARVVADPDQHAVLFHCAGGKDRTGILAAVLLDAVGVPADEIVADYALTGQRLEAIRRRLVQLQSYRTLPPVREGVLTAEPRVMRQFLTHLHAEFGGAAQWLRRHGFALSDLTRLRQALIEP